MLKTTLWHLNGRTKRCPKLPDLLPPEMSHAASLYLRASVLFCPYCLQSNGVCNCYPISGCGLARQQINVNQGPCVRVRCQLGQADERHRESATSAVRQIDLNDRKKPAEDAADEYICAVSASNKRSMYPQAAGPHVFVEMLTDADDSDSGSVREVENSTEQIHAHVIIPSLETSQEQETGSSQEHNSSQREYEQVLHAQAVRTVVCGVNAHPSVICEQCVEINNSCVAVRDSDSYWSPSSYCSVMTSPRDAGDAWFSDVFPDKLHSLAWCRPSNAMFRQPVHYKPRRLGVLRNHHTNN
jgi:hypothetical protein